MIGEVVKVAAEVSKETSKEALKKSAAFNPDKRIEPAKGILEKNIEKKPFNPDQRIESVLDKEKIYTTDAERIKQASKSNGEWIGEKGNSEFRPNKQEAKEALESYGRSGIEYKDGNPDFSEVSEATINIDKMTSDRASNFRYADKTCADKWNAEARDGKTDWTRNDVKSWRHENRYSWHERIDKKTMDLVQRDIHDECKHFGGVAECKRMERLGGGLNV